VSAIVAIDEHVVPYRPADVQPVLLDVHRYAEWWPAPWRVKASGEPLAGVGTRFRVADGWLPAWVGEITAIEERRILLRFDGSLVGEGRWGLRGVIDGSAVLFRMDVDPASAWMRLVTWRLDMRRRQARHMLTVFRALDARLGQLGVERVPEPQRPGDRPPQKLIS
jgi:hypothetical protein